MNAAAILARAEASGVKLWLDGGAVKMKAARQPPADLLAALRENKEEVVHLLSAPTPPPEPESQAHQPGLHDEGERAALRQHYAEPARDRPSPTDLDYPASYRPTPASLLASASLRPTAWADPRAIPSPGSRCSCCEGRRWWADPLGWRCTSCHPAPPGIRDMKEANT